MRADQDATARSNRAFAAIGARRAKLFLAIAAGPTLLLGLALAAFNAYVDPLWALPQIGDRPFLYCVKDERQNKLNRIVHGRISVDSLLVGSSRAAFVDTNFFRKDRVFNLAVNGMRPIEYPEYVRFFVQRHAAPRRIYAAFDYWGFRDESDLDRKAVDNARAKAAQATKPFYSVERLLDWSVAAYGWEVVSKCNNPDYARPRHRYDGIEYVKRTAHDSVHEQAVFDQTQQLVWDLFSEGRFKPDANFPAHLRNLREAAAGGEIVPFVLPITAAMFSAIMAESGLGAYFSWIESLLNEFGAVRHFSGLNGFTRNRQNFFDSHHVYAELTQSIVDVLEGRVQPTDDGFGLLITKENFSQFKDSLRQQVCGEAGRSEKLRTDCPAVEESPASEDADIVFALSAQPRNWYLATTKVQADANGAGIGLSSASGISEYLLMSEPIDIDVGATYEVDARIRLVSGAMSVGVLDLERNRWLTLIPIRDNRLTRRFKATGPKVQLVVALNNPEPAKASATIQSLELKRPASR